MSYPRTSPGQPAAMTPTSTLSDTGWGSIAGLTAGVISSAVFTVITVLGVLLNGGLPAELIFTLTVVGFAGAVVGAFTGGVIGAIAGYALAATGSQRHARPVAAALALIPAIGIAAVTLSEGVTPLPVVGAALVLVLLPAVGWIAGTMFGTLRTRSLP